MRRATSFMLSLVVVPAGVLAAPVVTPPAPDARPVPAKVHDISLPATMTAAAAPSSSSDGPRTVVATTAQTTKPFETLGVTWRQDPDVGVVEVSARTRTGGRWTSWTELEEEEGVPANGTPEAVGARGGTEPAWVGPSDGVQVRVDVVSGKAPSDLRLTLVDPGESAADAAVSSLPAAVATAASARPAIRSRAQWGADETLRTGSPSYASSIYAATVHHTASSNSYEPADVPGIMRSFYAYHVRSRGWSDIGYNIIVDKYGTAWEGRAGGLDKPVIGAHAGGFNTGTVGISLIGTYDSVEPTAVSLETVAQLAAWKLSSYGRDPKSTVTLTSGGSTKYPAGTKVTLPRIFGHLDVSSTGCPGGEGYASLPGLRERTAKIVAAAPTTEPADPGTGEEPDSTPTPTPSPTPTGKPPFGALESASGGTESVSVRGWAIDPDASTYTSVAISVDGTVSRTFVASTYRPDVAAANPPYSPNHGFEGTVPAAAGTRQICATAKNQGSGSDVALGCRSATVSAAAPPPPPPPPPGPVPASSTAPPPARATNDSCPSGRVPSSSFRDTGSSVHAAAIDCAVWWQITGGTSPSTYAPLQGVTRAQMASFLARTILRSGGSLPSSPPDAFSDDASTGTHQQAINQLAAVGVVTGKGGRTYAPADVVTRDQMATFLVRAYEYRTRRVLQEGADYFADDNGNVHEVNIGKVARAGFTGGSGDGRFRPSAPTDRGQMASFLSRVLDLLVEAGDTPEHA